MRNKAKKFSSLATILPFLQEVQRTHFGERYMDIACGENDEISQYMTFVFFSKEVNKDGDYEIYYYRFYSWYTSDENKKVYDQLINDLKIF